MSIVIVQAQACYELMPLLTVSNVHVCHFENVFYAVVLDVQMDSHLFTE